MDSLVSEILINISNSDSIVENRDYNEDIKKIFTSLDKCSIQSHYDNNNMLVDIHIFYDQVFMIIECTYSSKQLFLSDEYLENRILFIGKLFKNSILKTIIHFNYVYIF